MSLPWRHDPGARVMEKRHRADLIQCLGQEDTRSCILVNINSQRASLIVDFVCIVSKQYVCIDALSYC